ncbi:hypothetical protein DEI81_11070 [Curtobacterium sp. MCBD17_013]|nr:hypothetical protein DEI81_11070 [Curtobacterium sp. MCBD17_013]
MQAEDDLTAVAGMELRALDRVPRHMTTPRHDERLGPQCLDDDGRQTGDRCRRLTAALVARARMIAGDCAGTLIGPARMAARRAADERLDGRRVG